MRANELSRRAMAAVARLTMIASAAGCTGQVIIEADDTENVPEPGEVDPADTPDVTVDNPTPDTACFDGEGNDAACCSAVLDEAFATNALWNNPALATADQKGCCEMAVGTMDNWMGDGTTEPPFTFESVNACCGTGLVVNDFSVHPACTPWGPPMPPAMAPMFNDETWGIA
ncbi:MAG: hypothetical protein IPK82_21885 [Polyangiaceae bacterium]|nr:hypothetical protein [Polyangiaceae bacterium]